MDLTGRGILTTETMLRTAQAEIDDLTGKLKASLVVLARLEAQLKQATLNVCALVVQKGGEVTIAAAELEPAFKIERHTDPATHAVTWKVAVVEAKPALGLVP
jgi:hypothetical protein